MTNKPRIVGTRWETGVATFLQENGFPAAERRALHGNKDRGDIAGVPGIVIECKRTKGIDLGTASKEAEAATRNADADAYVLVHHRRMRGVADAYATVPFWFLVLLLRIREDVLAEAARDERKARP